MESDIQIMTHNTPVKDFRQLAYLWPNGIYNKHTVTGTEWFTINETLATDAVGIIITTDQKFVNVERTWFLEE
tara:strand:+ start:751 stop:969 length:219 start_codon:yes stop_codon:yes gene_type:complete